MKLEPLKLIAPCKDYIWGGTKLRDGFGKKSDQEKIAESWELSVHKDGKSVIENGEFSGKTLEDYFSAVPTAIGENAKRFEYFPILIKLIDAHDDLSVQVHPDNEYALKAEGEYGKTEMWYIVDAAEGAELIYGFKKEISREEFRQRIENDTLLEVTNNVPVKKGDVFFIGAGTLHAIGKGIVIAEIQQNSNTTYRVYDYNRKDASGNPRELHIEKAIDVTQLKKPDTSSHTHDEIKYRSYSERLLADSEYFTVKKLDIINNVVLAANRASFNSLLILDGTLELMSNGNDKIIAKKGDSLFIPAGLGEYTIIGKGEVILTYISK